MAKVRFESIDFVSNFLDTDQPNRIIYEDVDAPRKIAYNTILPFKVRFSSIGIPGVAGLVPPIGIAVVGVNNYIL